MEFTPEEVAALAAEREGRRLEWKSGLPRDEKTARSLAAFANTRGGILLVGVGDHGEILGAPHPRETLASLRRIAREVIDPPLDVACGLTTVHDRPIAWCSVPLSPRRPHAVLRADGSREIVVRAGSSNRAATGATLAALQRGRTSKPRLGALERSVLSWVEQRAGSRPGGDATADAFARAHNIGRQRARRAFTDLERAGLLVAHGAGARRAYSIP
ncbi:MAG: ATP-binding protein [Planctomycetes bacterium]|nr:ATP-binding protein [Planctomycetota bacterium]